MEHFEMSMPTYSIDVSHDGLHTFRRITGRDKYVVETKAAAQIAQWNEKWARMHQKEQALNSIFKMKAAADQENKKAASSISEIESILANALDRDSKFDWNVLKENSSFGKPQPPLQAPKEHPAQPIFTDRTYPANIGFFDHLIPSRKQKKRQDAQLEFEVDIATSTE
jgi:restriction system protein